jgi:hypothetical protein
MNRKCHIAVLSYHGWEIDAQLVVDDVRHLRDEGWHDVSLEELHRILSGHAQSRNAVFHVTSDDGSRGDADFVAALRLLSCPATFFVCLERMDRGADGFFRELARSSEYHIGDHTLRHDRAFQFRHVVGFYHTGKPVVSSPERLGLKMGAPICSYGPELCSPIFTPTNDAIEACREAARWLQDTEPGHEWSAALSAALVKSGFGFYRLGKLCVRGEYEGRPEWKHRIRTYLSQGREALLRFTGKEPLAFAYPWWQPGNFAEHCLRALEYKLTFSGRGLCKALRPFWIPRLPINATTPRPLDLAKLDSLCPPPTAFVGSFARRLLYA